jgi:hypothetical protein
MDDPFLNYFALGVLCFVVVVLFYGIIAIHDIPYVIAKSRDHPHQDAIYAAGWVTFSPCTHCGRSSGSGQWPTVPTEGGASLSHRKPMPTTPRSQRR